MVKRVYFGNWLRDYSQAMDVGTLKSIQADTIRILLWVLSFLTFGYATEEFEVTSERLGVYRPEEHIDNPKNYADDKDAREYDQRLRPPVQQFELDIDPRTGMKNYIANDDLGIATSSGYVRFSLSRSIHFGRIYTNGASGTRGKQEDLYEAMRCLGQALHTLEDFAAHSNYIELALREMGRRNVFPHCGSATEMEFQGRRAFPLVTGTFGVVDFVHSVLGEATDHLSQSEVDELNKALGEAQGAEGSSRGFGDSNTGLSNLTGLLSQVPGAGELSREAVDLQTASQEQERANEATNFGSNLATPQTNFLPPPGFEGGPPAPGIPGMGNFDPQKTIKQIYPILQFRDKVVRALEQTIEKIPGLEALVDKITETVTLFVMSLLAPFIRPIITAISQQVKTGSGSIVDASGRHQYEPWTDPHCTDPTHSLLAKDHFANVLNEPAGQIAAIVLQYTAPRVIYAWQHPDIPVDQVVNDVLRSFHHPALRNNSIEIHCKMFEIVEKWSRSRQDIDVILSSESVKAGKNLTGSVQESTNVHYHGAPQLPTTGSLQNTFASSLQSQFGSILKPFAKFTGGGGGPGSREMDPTDEIGTETAYDSTRPPTGPDYQQQPAYNPRAPYQTAYQQPPLYDGVAPSQGPHHLHADASCQGGLPPYEQNRTPEPPQQYGYGYGQPQSEYQSSYGHYQGGPPTNTQGYQEGYQAPPGPPPNRQGFEENYQAPPGPPPGRQYYGESQQGGYYGGGNY